MTTTLFLIALATFCSTFLGGLFALRFKDKLHLIAGFSAGAVIGVALFDLLPTSFTLAAGNFSTASLMIGLGFVLYLVLERSVALHSHNEDCENMRHRGVLGASSLSFHSFLDGVVIGLAFQVSSAIGLVVTAAVLTHDFSDGINTVVIVMRGSDNKTALRWLIIDAAAPVVGVLSTFLFTIPQTALGTTLGIICGCFLYIGASDLLPESHHAHPKLLTTGMTLLGMGIMYGVIQVAK
ncbi:MAG TPA: ZIP family metal transporter [Bacteroidota bacterium]|nr:ZIP family metal transporter [Bacteroidota bacterium]